MKFTRGGLGENVGIAWKQRCSTLSFRTWGCRSAESSRLSVSCKKTARSGSVRSCGCCSMRLRSLSSPTLFSSTASFLLRSFLRSSKNKFHDGHQQHGFTNLSGSRMPSNECSRRFPRKAAAVVSQVLRSYLPCKKQILLFPNIPCDISWEIEFLEFLSMPHLEWVVELFKFFPSFPASSVGCLPNLDDVYLAAIGMSYNAFDSSMNATIFQMICS